MPESKAEKGMRKPPLGITPELLWKEERVWALIECLARHSSESKVPPEWVGELRRLIDELQDATSGTALSWLINTPPS